MKCACYVISRAIAHQLVLSLVVSTLVTSLSYSPTAFSTVKFLFFSFIILLYYYYLLYYLLFHYSIIISKSLNPSPHYSGGELSSTSWKEETLHKLFRIFPKEDFSLLLHLFVQSIMYIRMYSWIFTSLFWVINTINTKSPILLLIILLFKWFLLWPFGTLSGWLLCSFGMLPFYSSFLNTVTLWHYKMLQVHFAFSLPSPRINHFFKEPWFFYLRMVFRSEYLGLGMLVITGVSQLLCSLNRQT